MRLKDHAPSVERIAKSVGWIPRAVVEDTFDCPAAAGEVHMPKPAVGIYRHRIPNANLRGLTRWKRPGFEGDKATASVAGNGDGSEEDQESAQDAEPSGSYELQPSTQCQVSSYSRLRPYRTACEPGPSH